MRLGTALRLLAVALPALASGAVGAGCSLGFDKFDPQAGGGGADGAPPDADVDAAAGSADTGAPQDSGALDDSPAPDGSGSPQDSAGQEAAAGEAGCPGQQSCLSQAASCGNPCNTTYQQCTAKCQGGNQQQCRAMCKTTEQQCRSQCAQTCVSCTTSAGCTDNSGCVAAAQM